MPIYFYSGIQKAAPSITHARLRAILAQKEPRVARLLARLWRAQATDITYAELRRAILTGELDEATIKRWRQDYSLFVTRDLMPEWRAMVERSVTDLYRRYPTFAFDPASEAVADYTARHSAEFVTNCTAQQIDAIRTVVQRAGTVQDMPVDELARVIRPMIGLYRGQAAANLNYYTAMKQSLQEHHPNMRTSAIEERAQRAALRYAEKQHRYRAMMIARTELSFAYNNGEYHGVRNAQEQGLIGTVVKRSVSAGDGRVCGICSAMDGQTAPMDAPFPGGDLTPPYHPHCRCVVNYEETEN